MPPNMRLPCKLPPQTSAKGAVFIVLLGRQSVPCIWRFEAEWLTASPLLASACSHAHRCCLEYGVLQSAACHVKRLNAGHSVKDRAGLVKLADCGAGLPVSGV